MEIRFSMTPRLIGLTLGCSLLLLVLVFTLGFLFGQRLKPGVPDAAARGVSTSAPLPQAAGVSPLAPMPQLPPNPMPAAPVMPNPPAGR